MSDLIPNFTSLNISGKNIYRGGQPTDEGWNQLRNIGITKVIKLNLESEGSDVAGEALGMQIVYCPICILEQVIGPVEACHLIKALFNISNNTYIHCEHGQDRTGLICALYKYCNGLLSKQDAEQEMLNLGFHKLLVGLWECWEHFNL